MAGLVTVSGYNVQDIPEEAIAAQPRIAVPTVILDPTEATLHARSPAPHPGTSSTRT